MSHRFLGPQFFHGTTAELSEGDRIEPSSVTGASPTFARESDSGYAYASESEIAAWDYAEKSFATKFDGIPRVYQVTPAGEHEEDPLRDAGGYRRGNYIGDRRSRVGWDVVRELPMPEHVGTPEDFDPEEWR